MKKFRLVVITPQEGDPYFKIQARYGWRNWFLHIFCGWSTDNVGEWHNYDLPFTDFDKACQAIEHLRRIERYCNIKTRIINV